MAKKNFIERYICGTFSGFDHRQSIADCHTFFMQWLLMKRLCWNILSMRFGMQIESLIKWLMSAQHTVHHKSRHEYVSLFCSHLAILSGHRYSSNHEEEGTLTHIVSMRVFFLSHVKRDLESFARALLFPLSLWLTIGNGSVREGPNRTGSEPNRLKILKLEPNRTEPRNR